MTSFIPFVQCVRWVVGCQPWLPSLLVFALVGSGSAQETGLAEHGEHPSFVEYLPEPLSDLAFEAIRDSSPFRRTIQLSDSIVLTGMARIEGEVFATLFDTATMETHLVAEIANSEGWQLVDLAGDEADLESLTAKIQVEGGEVVSIRYENTPLVARPGSGMASSGKRLSEKDLSEAKEMAQNFKKEASFDGYSKVTPELIRKLSAISSERREAINRVMIGLRNQGVGMSERRQTYDRLLEGAPRSRR